MNTDFFNGMIVGYWIAGLSIGTYAFFKVQSWRFDTIEYRKEIQAFLMQNNKLIEGMQNSGFLKINIDGEKASDD